MQIDNAVASVRNMSLAASYEFVSRAATFGQKRPVV